MKRILFFASLLTAAVVLPSVFAKNPGHGTNILHFFVRKTMNNTGIIPDATGHVNGMLVRQGKANNQKFDISVTKLSANTAYSLAALVGDDTNFTDIAEFNTDAVGSAKIQYRRMGANGNSGLGRGKFAMPDGLNPISNLRELAVVDTNSQVVLSADLTAPDKLQYLVKRSLANDGVEPDAGATLRLHGTTTFTQFRVLASGLQTNSTYSLAINGNVNETKTSDANGNLNFTTLLVNPIDILDARTLAIWNSASNSVLSTLLP